MYKMAIKILQLCLFLGSSFKEFVKFLLGSAIVEIAVTNKTLIKTIISTVTFCQYDFRICNQKFDTLF